ncbi:MAG: hypothetical protein JNJ63_13190 [Hyphomonadaceae bacterium]|nr:hypothetical protein [Hyphomonadaceae bacterium]
MSESAAVIIAALIAAASALWIGWLQFASLNHQNKWQMREARLKIYNACRDMLVVASQYELTDEIRSEFLRAEIGVGFLFDSDVVSFIKEARDQMHTIDVFKPDRNSDASPEQKKEHLAKYHAAWRRVGEMVKQIDVVFAPYLDFRNLR